MENANALNSGNARQLTGSKVFSDELWAEFGKRHRLSRRELQMARAALDGHKEFAIANALNLSPRTVHNHFQHLYQKLEVDSRGSLIVRIYESIMALKFGPLTHTQPRQQTGPFQAVEQHDAKTPCQDPPDETQGRRGSDPGRGIGSGLLPTLLIWLDLASMLG